MRSGWKGLSVVKDGLDCFGSNREILERAMVVAAMAGFMYPLYEASSNAAAAADFIFFWCSFSAVVMAHRRRVGVGRSLDELSMIM